jgi:hypothetical protein
MMRSIPPAADLPKVGQTALVNRSTDPPDAQAVARSAADADVDPQWDDV